MKASIVLSILYNLFIYDVTLRSKDSVNAFQEADVCHLRCKNKHQLGERLKAFVKPSRNGLKCKTTRMTNYEDHGDDDFGDDDEYYVTDEQALLACRAYLQRKNRLGWTQAKRRKSLAQNSLALHPLPSSPLEDATSGSKNLNAGYFWEDPGELIYLKNSRPRQLVQKNKLLGKENETVIGGGEILFEFSDEEDEEEEEEEEAGEEMDDIQLLKNVDDGGIFTSFPAFPPTTHVRQSQSRKELFQDPKWKAQWYKKRWGSKKSMEKRQRDREQKRIQTLIKQIPSEILRSPELAALTNEEIEDAIDTYMLANTKRKEAHLKRTKQRKENLPSTTGEVLSNRNTELSLTFTPSNNELKEIQKKRSEKAAKAYKTRLKNKKMKQMDRDTKLKKQITHKSRALREITVEGELSPRQAMERIEETIRDNNLPLIQDIDTLLKPKRLSGRKELLKIVLKDCFNLMGKCVPDVSRVDSSENDFYASATNTDVDSTQKKFVTQCTVYELGSYIKYLLRAHGEK